MRKNILIISSKSADFGGVEYHVLDLIKAFSLSNTIYVWCPNGPMVSQYKNAGATVLINTPKAPYDFNFALKIKKFCEEKNIDIVHAHELISAQGMLGAFIARVNIRVWHVHTPFLFWKHKNIITKILKSIPNWSVNFITSNILSTDVIALTDNIKKHRKIFELVINSPVHTIPNAINIDMFSMKYAKKSIADIKKSLNIPIDKIIIGNMSRTTAEKGQNLLLETFKLINLKYPNKYFLLIAGGGELEKVYIDYCNKNFKDSFLITGRFEDNMKVKLLKIMDYFIFPSLAEGFGYVLTEAIACKIPVVASNIEVLKKVGGEGVYYFKSGDTENLTKVLIDVLNLNENTKIKNIERSFTKIQEYSFENFVINYSRVYKI